MRKKYAFVAPTMGLASLVFASGCGGTKGATATPDTSAPVNMPATVDLCLMGATIAPTKTDGSPWQPLGAKRTEEQAEAWSDLLKAGAKFAGLAVPQAALAASVAKALSPAMIDVFQKPRVYGVMKLAPRGAYTEGAENVVTIAGPKKSVASFTPRFGDEVCFKNVAWHPDLRFSVTLNNHHTVRAEEVIATVEVLPGALTSTYQQGGVCQVPVGDRDPNVALLLVRVTKGAGSTE
jgi:hypothetical protein